MSKLILEIGTEEIPAGYIESSLSALSSLLVQKLVEARVEHGSASIFGTPRRLAVMIDNIADRQTSLTTEFVGPPERIGFDEEGNATVAAEKFADKIGVPVNALKVKKTEKGTYLCAEKTVVGIATKTLLKTMLPGVIKSIPFPKTMRWSDLDVRFARPIQSILALFDKSIISFVVGNIKSNRYSLGHRFMHPKRITITSADGYVDTLKSGYVIVDISERKETIRRAISKTAADIGGVVLPDDDLVDTVTNLVEYPVAVTGKIDERFLELPKEIMITAMREHQKYFAIINEAEDLMPFFIAVNNTSAQDLALVAKGHERVLRARLEDAQFFYNSDSEQSFEALTDQLNNVLFQTSLGSMYEKVMRVQALTEFVARSIDHTSSEIKKLDNNFIKNIRRAAFLCKTDLISQVVNEFPKLQGTMGRVYALNSGECNTVATAIEEHYLPAYSGGPLPSTIEASVLAISDKMDTISGCFSIGLIPTGTSDPYALRRQGIGIIQIMLDKNFTFSLKEVLDNSLNPYDLTSKTAVSDKIYEFLRNRVVNLLVEEGFSRDVVFAVTDVSVDHIPDVWNRAHALEKLKAAPDFEPLAVSFKRVVNIIKQANFFDEPVGDINKNLLTHESELRLYDTFNNMKHRVSEHLDHGDFDQALLDIASMRDSIDAFFDNVMVMTDDTDLRINRLTILRQIADLFGWFADFSRIST